MTINISQRAVALPASPIRRLAPYAVKAQKAGKHIYGLNIGQPDIPTPKQVIERLHAYNKTNVPYGPSQGLDAFLQTLVTYYAQCGLNVSSDHIFVCTGGSEAICFTLAAIMDPGDEMLVFEPFYTNYNGFGTMLGVQLVPVTTYAENGYHLPSKEQIVSRISKKTRAMLICSPNNPTGTVYSDAEIDMLAQLCEEHGLYLIADEVYREFTYDNRKHRSVLELPALNEQAIVVDSISKRLSLCGVRVGNIVTRNKQVLDAVLKMGQARLCPPTLGQYACIGFDAYFPDYIKEVIADYEERRNTVHEALVRMPDVLVKKPEGAFYLCAKLPVANAEDFSIFLLDKFSWEGKTVQLAPADGFYATQGLGKNEVRIAYVLCKEDLVSAMHVLQKGLEAYNKTTS